MQQGEAVTKKNLVESLLKTVKTNEISIKEITPMESLNFKALLEVFEIGANWAQVWGCI